MMHRRMVVLFGTLGYTPRKLLPSVTQHAPRKVVFFHDKVPRSVEAAGRVVEHCRAKGIPVKAHPVDAFEVVECARRLREELRKENPDEVVFNVTGGTPVLSTAATVLCVLEGVRAVYVDERSDQDKPLPLLTISYREVVPPEQRRVLHAIATGAGTQRELQTRLRLSRSTVNYHVVNLKERRLIEAKADPKDRRRELLEASPSAVLLLDED